jgi:hypothetical protein
MSTLVPSFAAVANHQEAEEEEAGEGDLLVTGPSGRGDNSNPNWVADRFKCGQSHDGSPTTGPNDWLAKKFDEMHDMYQGAQHKNSFQVRGYQKGKSTCDKCSR